MTDRGAPPPQQQADALRTEHHQHLEGVGAALDLDAGLDDVFQRAENAHYVRGLRDDVLDVRAGLAAALATVEASDPEPERSNDAGEDTSAPASTIRMQVTWLSSSASGPVEIRFPPVGEDGDAGTVFERISRLRSSIVETKTARSLFTQKALTEAAGHLEFLGDGLRHRRLSRSRAHEVLAEAEGALGRGVKPSRPRRLTSGVGTLIMYLFPTLIGLGANMSDALARVASSWWAAVPQLVVILLLMGGAAGGGRRGRRRTSRRGRMTEDWNASFNRLHVVVDHLFDSADDYSGVGRAT